MSYLIHFNGNHSSKNGQFITGDGDGDGIIDDQHNDTTKRRLKWVVNNQFILDIAADIVCSAARKAAGYAFSKTKLAKEIEDTHIKEVGEEFIKVTQLDVIARDAGLVEAKNALDAKVKGKVAEEIQKGANKAIDQYL